MPDYLRSTARAMSLDDKKMKVEVLSHGADDSDSDGKTLAISQPAFCCLGRDENVLINFRESLGTTALIIVCVCVVVVTVIF